MRLKIKNVGPVRDINISLTKINVIIGPQSSGKSTINKLACYLFWVEKKICIDQSFDYFYGENVFLNNLEVFHKLDGYVTKESYIEYNSDVLTIKFEPSKSLIPHFKWKDQYGYKRPKISYIPAERNVVSVIPNWIEVRFEENNIKNYMTDWNTAREIAGVGNPLNIDSLGVDYYYDKKKQGDFIKIKVDEKNNKPIKLTNTSSGIQSIVPIYVLINYFLNTIEKRKEDKSIKEDEKNKELESKLAAHLFSSHLSNHKEISIDSLSKEFKNLQKEIDLLQKISKNNQLLDTNTIQEKINEISKSPAFQLAENQLRLTQNYLENNHLNLFLEEPETNLFPSTQQSLLYYLIEQINMNMIEGSTLMLTTHSPFILYALNNCILGGMISDKIEKSDAEKFKSYKAWINPDKVSVWEIHNGKLKEIKDPKLKIIGQHYFNDIMGDTLGEYSSMLKYFKK